eukprot:GHVU01013590.1.p2 GENE.GHVU01013590.1~~GHVU01013590.1.p2  ORF type:complete len:120 (+),score=5.43 GHVU01013590.1:266-625(+)
MRIHRPCGRGCGNDQSSIRNCIHHMRHTHQALRCRFDCPKCGDRLGTDLHSTDKEHIACCYNGGKGLGRKGKKPRQPLQFPTQELWDTTNRQWIGCPAYRGDWMYIDSYAFLEPRGAAC